MALARDSLKHAINHVCIDLCWPTEAGSSSHCGIEKNLCTGQAQPMWRFSVVRCRRYASYDAEGIGAEDMHHTMQKLGSRWEGVFWGQEQ